MQQGTMTSALVNQHTGKPLSQMSSRGRVTGELPLKRSVCTWNRAVDLLGKLLPSH